MAETTFDLRTDEALILRTHKGDVLLSIVEIRNDRCRLGIEADRAIPAWRGELNGDRKQDTKGGQRP